MNLTNVFIWFKWCSSFCHPDTFPHSYQFFRNFQTFLFLVSSSLFEMILTSQTSELNCYEIISINLEPKNDKYRLKKPYFKWVTLHNFFGYNQAKSFAFSCDPVVPLSPSPPHILFITTMPLVEIWFKI